LAGVRVRTLLINRRRPQLGQYFADGRRLCQLIAVNDPRNEYVVAQDCATGGLFVIRSRDLAKRWCRIDPAASSS
jgi:hypothetical protein